LRFLESARARLVVLVAVLVAAIAGVALWRSNTSSADDELRGGRFDLMPYEGLGTWVDVFDYAPRYQNDGVLPSVTPEDLPAMAALGVETLYLQAARLDDRAPDGIVDVDLVGRFLQAGHEAGIRVVGWYLPKHGDNAADLERLLKIAGFEWQGHRFDGLTVDIEDVETVPDIALRNQRLIELSKALKAELGDDAVVGAGVIPPVQLEVINPAYWPSFPWAEVAPYFDVWLPMTYWSVRREDSGWKDGYRYVVESTRRLRTNVGDPSAPVHPIAGIGDGITEDQLRDYLRSLTDTDALGGSVYDYRTTSGGQWGVLRGMGEALAQPPGATTTQPDPTTTVAT
jgi:hypothetical protein